MAGGQRKEPEKRAQARGGVGGSHHASPANERAAASHLLAIPAGPSSRNFRPVTSRGAHKSAHSGGGGARARTGASGERASDIATWLEGGRRRSSKGC
eukprot:366094-Chlamydomonas_euryale.AAC.11